MYSALALVSRAQLAKRWVETQKEDRAKKSRRIYYLSMEFLMGRALRNSLAALGLEPVLRKPLRSLSSQERRVGSALGVAAGAATAVTPSRTSSSP